MAFFRYTATDSSGKQVSGSLKARSRNEAEQQLNARGFRNVSFEGPNGASQPVGAILRTKPAQDDERSYLYSQAASMLRAGMSVNEAFTALANKVSNSNLREACRAIASAAREGRGASYVMERYVDLFPHNDVGMVRSGEYGGFLPEAFDYLARFYLESSAFKKRWFIVRRLLWRGFIGVALVAAIMDSFWTRIMQGLPGLGRQFLTNLLWPVLPCAAIALGGAYLFRNWLMSLHNLRLRHRLLLRVPFGIGERARQESLVAFLWTLRGLQAAGVAPSTAWALASASVPNAEMAVRLSEAGKAVGEMPLSEAARRSGLFPHDYESMLATGEHSGDVVGALEMMTKVSSGAYLREKDEAFSGVRTVGCLVSAVFFLLMAIMYIVGYFYGFFDLLEDL